MNKISPWNYTLCGSVVIACLILFSNHTSIAKEVAKVIIPPRVMSVVTSPGNVNDDGSGKEMWVQVDFVEPASAEDTLKLTIIPARVNPGETHWKDQKSFQSFPIHPKDGSTEVLVKIVVTKSGTIGIKAETSSKELNDKDICWMPVTFQPR